MGMTRSRPAFIYRSPRVLVVCHQCHQLGLRQGLGSNLTALPSGSPMVGGLFSPYQVIGSSSYPMSGVGYGSQCCDSYSNLGFGGLSGYGSNAGALPYSSSFGYGGMGLSNYGLSGMNSYGSGGFGSGSGLGGYGSYYVVGNELLGAGAQMMPQISAPCVPVVSCVPVITQAVPQQVR